MKLHDPFWGLAERSGIGPLTPADEATLDAAEEVAARIREQIFRAGLERVKLYLGEQRWYKHCKSCPGNIMTPDRLDTDSLLREFLGK